MNLAIRGIGANIAQGDSFHADASAPANTAERLTFGRKGRQVPDGRPACAPIDGRLRTHGIKAPGPQGAAAHRPGRLHRPGLPIG